ncbi:hypothetical protein BpHYR1_029122 [Brachionus plicatilis]|uniref:Uncharacterized protein n=1 Tax=Brachionus plicatilis TaxID=10195 RepID=A0A3M7PQ87_BRAPC|nr:hypothetical protein BpHYR1_029122 [Brachionus plicatilis]
MFMKMVEPKLSSARKQQALKLSKKHYFTRLVPVIYQFDNRDEYRRTCQIRNRAFVNMPKKGRPKNYSKD